MLQMEQASRKQTGIRLSVEGRSGSGLTYNALILAYGLSGYNWNQIVVIDTGSQNAGYYAHLGPFNTIQLGAPYHPDRFFEALELCELSDKKVVIIDSLTDEWIGESGMVDRLSGHYYQDALNAHRKLFKEISETSLHVISTVRTKPKLVHLKTDGKYQRRLVNMPIQQSGYEYNFNVIFRLDKRHRAQVIKDKTGILTGKETFSIEAETGLWLAEWAGVDRPKISIELQEKIDSCQSLPDLTRLLLEADVPPENVISFTRRRIELEQAERDFNQDKASTLQMVGGGLE